MSRRSINGHSRRRKNKHEAAQLAQISAMSDASTAAMKYVDENGLPLEGKQGYGKEALMGSSGVAGMIGYSGGKAASTSLGAKGFASILGTQAGNATGIGAIGMMVSKGLDLGKKIKEANIYKEGYTESNVGAMDLES